MPRIKHLSVILTTGTGVSPLKTELAGPTHSDPARRWVRESEIVQNGSNNYTLPTTVSCILPTVYSSDL